MHRDAHLERFDRLTGLLAIMSRTVVAAIRHSSTALLGTDPQAAEATLHDHAAICDLYQEIEDAIPILLARQQPVASDLRLVLAALRMNSDMKRMGALARHVATIAAAQLPSCAVPREATPVLAAMAHAAATMAEKSAIVLATRDPIDAAQLGLDDDEMDALLKDLFRLVTGDWAHGNRTAIDVAMLGRFYERFSDHAVSIAEHVFYIVTGETRTVPS